DQSSWTQEQDNFANRKGDKQKFTGHERDYIDDQHVWNQEYIDYMHARFYSPASGRFLSVDPGEDWDMSKPQSWNMYAYVRNNPINARDPDGRAIDVVIDAGSAAWGIGVMWKKALSGEPVTWTDNLAVAADLGAAVIPGVTGAGIAVRVASKAENVADVISAGSKGGRVADDTLQILFQVKRNKGNFGLGEMTASKAEKVGRAWVGDTAVPLMKGDKQIGLISEDGTKVYRFAERKTRSGKYQANIEEVTTSAAGKRTVIRNGHIDVVE
ncbi:MAG TPA: RHS repeat-associated core domain-containing protein, partial [Thermoanaerobaculia bacterium]